MNLRCQAGKAHPEISFVLVPLKEEDQLNIQSTLFELQPLNIKLSLKKQRDSKFSSLLLKTLCYCVRQHQTWSENQSQLTRNWSWGGRGKTRSHTLKLEVEKKKNRMSKAESTLIFHCFSFLLSTCRQPLKQMNRHTLTHSLPPALIDTCSHMRIQTLSHMCTCVHSQVTLNQNTNRFLFTLYTIFLILSFLKTRVENNIFLIAVLLDQIKQQNIFCKLQNSHSITWFKELLKNPVKVRNPLSNFHI